MPFLFRRLAELFGAEIILSVVVAVMCMTGVLPGNYTFAAIISAVMLAVNLIWQFIALWAYRRYCGELTGIFYRTNFFAVGMLTIVTSLAAVMNFEPLYTYMFMPFKLFYYMGLCGKYISALLVDALFAAEVLAIGIL